MDVLTPLQRSKFLESRPSNNAVPEMTGFRSANVET
jgi:hypothetical protein